MPTIYARWILGICPRFGNNPQIGNNLYQSSEIMPTIYARCPDLEIIYLLILTDQIGPLHQFTAKALHWRANLFGGNGAPK